MIVSQWIQQCSLIPPIHAPPPPRPRRPPPPRYSQPTVVVPLAGILPFGSIFIEMYFILTSLWGYMYYYVYGFVLLVFAILVVVLVCTTIVAVYFVLNGEVRSKRRRVGFVFSHLSLARTQRVR